MAGRPYTEYVRDAILSPLGMSSTAFEPPAADLAAGRLATGYAARGFSDEPVPAIADPPSQAEGGLVSCVEDLARWIASQFRRDAERGGTQVLAGRTLREMHRPRYLGNDDWTEAWCIAWYAVRRDDVVWVQHSGGLHGFATDVCFHPEDRVGAIVLVNGSRSGELAMDLGTIAREAVRAAPAAIEPPPRLSPEWRALLGFYADPEYDQVLRLEWRDGKLTFLDPAMGGQATTLTPAGGRDAFVVDAGAREAGERCTFHRRADDRVRSVALGPAVLRRLDPLDDG